MVQQQIDAPASSCLLVRRCGECEEAEQEEAVASRRSPNARRDRVQTRQRVDHDLCYSSATDADIATTSKHFSGVLPLSSAPNSHSQDSMPLTANPPPLSVHNTPPSPPWVALTEIQPAVGIVLVGAGGNLSLRLSRRQLREDGGIQRREQQPELLLGCERG